MIYYIIPKYIEEIGDCCVLCNSEGEFTFRQSITTKLRSMFKEKCMDYRATKDKCGDILNQRNLTPLYYGEEEILIPIKVRDSIIPKDALHGYVNLSCIVQIEDKHLLLRNDHKLFFYDTTRIIKERIRMAKLLQERFYSDSKHYELRKFTIPASLMDVENIIFRLNRIEEAIKKIS